MKTLSLLVTSMVAFTMSTTCFSDEPRPKEFAEGINLTAANSQPLIELSVPDGVYKTVTQWNLADIRVFNANGDVVPHAFCNSQPPASSSEMIDVPVFNVDERHPSGTTQSNITLHTADGTVLTIESAAEKDNKNVFRTNASYILDVRKIKHQISSIEIDWSLPSGASETSVNIFSSSDLSHWQLLASNAKLVRAVGDNHSTLELNRVPLPLNQYDYLRIEPAGDVLIINHAHVAYQPNYATPGPTWYSAGVPHGADDPHELLFTNSHRVAVSALRITPHVDNSSIHVTVQSRDRNDHAWQTQWTGEVFDVQFNDQTRHNQDIAIGNVEASEWRLLFPDNTEPPTSAPSIEFGYFPMRLRFLAQGSGPYTLAYGNARVTNSVARRCDELLSSINSTDKQQLIGNATVGSTQLLAGKDALVIKKKIPTRTLLLWGILLIGAAVIMKMALSTLQTTKQQDKE